MSTSKLRRVGEGGSWAEARTLPRGRAPDAVRVRLRRAKSRRPDRPPFPQPPQFERIRHTGSNAARQEDRVSEGVVATARRRFRQGPRTQESTPTHETERTGYPQLDLPCPLRHGPKQDADTEHHREPHAQAKEQGESPKPPRRRCAGIEAVERAQHGVGEPNSDEEAEANPSDSVCEREVPDNRPLGEPRQQRRPECDRAGPGRQQDGADRQPIRGENSHARMVTPQRREPMKPFDSALARLAQGEGGVRSGTGRSPRSRAGSSPRPCRTGARGNRSVRARDACCCCRACR